jgi:DNA-binding transcriptional regulator YiaG
MSPQIQEAVADVHALCEAIEGGAALEQVATVRTCRIDMPLPDLSAEEVGSIRESLGLSQALFSEFLGVGLPTVRSWEQSHRIPSALARRFLGEIRDDPPFWRK